MISSFFDAVYLFVSSGYLDEFFAMVVVAMALLNARRLFRREK